MCLNLFVFRFLVTPCLVVAVQPYMEWIPIKKKVKSTGVTRFQVNGFIAQFTISFASVVCIFRNFQWNQLSSHVDFHEILALLSNERNQVNKQLTTFSQTRVNRMNFFSFAYLWSFWSCWMEWTLTSISVGCLFWSVWSLNQLICSYSNHILLVTVNLFASHLFCSAVFCQSSVCPLCFKILY